MSDAAPPPSEVECQRCSLPLHGREAAHDCRMCDPICPVWGTHGHLWNGDEESSRAAYLAGCERLWVPPTQQDYERLSLDAKVLIWQILNGEHHGAHPVVDTPAEREALAARCIVSDGEHIWVTQEIAGPCARPDRCTARPRPSCSSGPLPTTEPL